MAIPLTLGYIYFLESDAGTNQDWIVISTPPDPTDIDLTTFTEGTEYCKLEIPRQWRKRFLTGIIVTDSGGGTTFDYRTGRKGYATLASGIETSVANADLVEKFFMISRHTSGASTTFKAYYMIIIFSATVYATFIDEADQVQEYCPVRATGGEVIWSESTPQTALVKLSVRSIWQ